jgi:hypothetical protein
VEYLLYFQLFSPGGTLKRYLFILVAALLGTHVPESLGYEPVSKINLKLAQLAIAGAKRTPVLNQKLEEKLKLYRQWHLDLKSARNGPEFNAALDNIERDLDRHATAVSLATGREGPAALKEEIQKARVEVQRGKLDQARARVERAATSANNIGLNI